jgi:hypothetical protein
MPTCKWRRAETNNRDGACLHVDTPQIANILRTLAAREHYFPVMTDDGVKMIDGVFGQRYGEVLLLRVAADGPEATVYNTFPLNDCPAELWDKLDAQAIATENGAAAALLNGPRYWLMSSIGKQSRDDQEHKSFGGLEMIRQATVKLSSMNPAPYNVNRVDRKAIFVFDAGREIYELIDPEGRRWVMQTYSQTVDRGLALEDLPALASRLSLPPGWRYEPRTPSTPLRVDTTNTDACVTQDDLANSYSLQV